MPTSPLAVVAAAALAVAAVLPAQNPLPVPSPPSPGRGGSPMFATERYLFVLRGDELWQFDVDTLAPRHTFRFPGGEESRPVAKNRTELRASALAPIARAEATREPSARSRAVDAGLAWLARHQDDDGKWDCDAFMRHDREGEACDGAGSPVHDVGVTGLALLALLADGNTMRVGTHRNVVKQGVLWLREQQDASGRFGTNASHDFIYDHAIAALAMCEAFGLSNYQLLRESAQKGIDYLESHRNPYSAWRYQPRDNDNDTSVTTWAVCALASADYFGLQVNNQAFAHAATWYDQVTTADGRAGYTRRGEPSSRLPGDHATRFPPQNGETMTAAAAAARLLLGQRAAEHPVLAAAARVIASTPPRWEPGHVDAYYWYWGTCALANLDESAASSWNEALDTLVDHQRIDGNFAGSWDPVGVWDETGGRVYTTALCTLSLATADASGKRRK